ncbi:hypothetical protein [Thioclava sp. GXIMD4216]|uniref:Uncharacterized protein n=1 Tax=Thioclava litoralis TaxID=3076557 RepID=A0ABZ1DXG1_9RHOB|nr:hypothetical protein RPE78_09625 [Thioclava sp. FTW29]WRY33454.1 hypothetical protein RPE78_12330 [Thioclava sp. FTW29]
MDFTKFDSRSAADTPARLHLKDPANGEPLFADAGRTKPCIVLVRGTESRSVQAALRALQRAKLKDKPKKDEEVRSLEDLHGQMVDSAVPLVTGFENIARGEAALTTSEDDLRWFLNLQMLNGQEGEKSFVEQVLAFASTRESYLGNANAR